MRVTTAFKRLLRLPGASVIDVAFGAEEVVVTVRLHRRRRVCSRCGQTGRQLEIPGLRVIAAAVAVAAGVAFMVAPAASARARYHLVGRPIVAFAHFNPGRGYYYTVYARLTRPVPRLADGSTRAYFLLDRTDSIRDFATVGRKSRNCYAQVFDNTDIYTERLKRPRSGTSVPVSVVVRGFPPVNSTGVCLERTPKRALADADRFFGTKLGCYGRRAGTSRSSA